MNLLSLPSRLTFRSPGPLNPKPETLNLNPKVQLPWRGHEAKVRRQVPETSSSWKRPVLQPISTLRGPKHLCIQAASRPSQTWLCPGKFALRASGSLGAALEICPRFSPTCGIGTLKVVGWIPRQCRGWLAKPKLVWGACLSTSAKIVALWP